MKTAHEPSDREVSFAKSKKLKIEDVDYELCIICQTYDRKTKLNKVQKETAKKLKVAMDARNDSVAYRLKNYVENELWVEEKVPKWHKNCRSWYTNEKNYNTAMKKQGRSIDSKLEEEPSTSRHTRCATRSSVPTFIAKKHCVICGKEYHRSRRPTMKVTTKSREKQLKEQAKSLKKEGEEVLRRIAGAGHDMVANDICYHKECMDKFLTRKPKKGKSVQQVVYDKVFLKFAKELEVPLFKEQKGFLVRKLRDRFRKQLEDHGVKYGGGVRSHTLKLKLTKHFGSRISILDQSGGSGFLCSSDVNLGNAIEKLRKLEGKNNIDKRQEEILQAASLIREDMHQCKKDNIGKSIELSEDAASHLVPDSLFNFSASLLSGKKELPEGSPRISVDTHTEKKALILSQQILFQITGIATPIATASAHHLYNATRSKSLITLCNRLGQSISYDSLQRQLTAKAIRVIEKEEEEGAFIPDHITRQEIPHVFAIDNLDWRQKTLEGGSFNATTTIIVQNPSAQNTSDETLSEENVSVPSSSSANFCKSLQHVPNTQMDHLNVTKNERSKSRSLLDIESADSLKTECDGMADNVLLVWKLSRMASVSPNLLDVTPTDKMIPGYSAFCAEVFPEHDASKVGYFPLIPDTPTQPAVLQEAMKRCVEASKALRDEWTIITGDQATYELARTIREKNKDNQFDKVILLIGGFHQAYNFIKAICKIMRGSGVEEIVAAAGLCSDGTANKIFGEKSDYYQSLYALKILNEAIWRLFYSSFEEWSIQEDNTHWIDEVSQVVQQVMDGEYDLSDEEKINQRLTQLRSSLCTYQETLQDKPTAKYWLIFLEMTDILLRFLCYQREGNWFGHLGESAKMLPFLTAAGHHKYGQQSLPQYIAEMKQLPTTAPDVYDSFINGNFVARRATGSHNAVSPDMLLEQTYNADAKEVSGLGAITKNEAARTKWVYTKSLTAAASFKLKSMLDLNAETQNPHHEAGKARVTKDAALVDNVLQCMDKSPFSGDEQEHLINISTGQIANDDVQSHLTAIKELGQHALDKSIREDKKDIVKLKTLHTQNKKKKVGKRAQQNKSMEVTALLRLVKSNVGEGDDDVDVTDFIGNHECADYPPSLFDGKGNMRSTNRKSCLVKALKEETGVQPAENIWRPVDSTVSTSVIVDAMYVIRKWSFVRDTPFQDIADQYRRSLLSNLPQHTESVHFCCDRYYTNSLKSAERTRRAEPGGKVYEVSSQFRAPDPKAFFSVSNNKSALLEYLCEKWVSDEMANPLLGSMKLFLSGGFSDEQRCTLLTNGSEIAIEQLMSTHEEADTRMLLHAVYATQVEGVKRIVVYANDTDVIGLCIYYYKTMLQEMGLEELWMKTDQDSYLPIHEIASKLDTDLCQALPLIHSLSGRDITSYPFFIGKPTWLEKCKTVPLDYLARFAEADHDLTDDVIDQVRQLFISVYSSSNEIAQCNSLAELRAHKFLKSDTINLKRLPPTEDAFRLHLERSAYACIIDKTAHIAKPDLPDPKVYGWISDGDIVLPNPMKNPPWPPNASKGTNCACKKGCQRSCRCSKASRRCNIGCLCRGHPDTCHRAKLQEELARELAGELSSDEESEVEGEYDNTGTIALE